MKLLHLGCGFNKKPGWINMDADPATQADVVCDLRQRLPFDDDTVDFIYSEHFLEHLTREEGVNLLRECRRVLKPRGVVRVSIPDLEEFVRIYRAVKQGGKGLLSTWNIAGWEPQTAAQMMNEEFRRWGHQFIYDHEELWDVFTEAGFVQFRFRKWGWSPYAELLSIDKRPEHWNDIQAEGVK